MELAAKLDGGRAYFDTNIVIYLIEGSAEYKQPLAEIRKLLERSQLRFVTSELSLCECLIKPFKTNAAEAVSLYRTFLEDSGCAELLPIDSDVLAQAAYVAAQTGMKTPDAIHVSTAICGNCDLFLTNDKNIRMPKNMELALLSDYAGM